RGVGLEQQLVAGVEGRSEEWAAFEGGDVRAGQLHHRALFPRREPWRQVLLRLLEGGEHVERGRTRAQVIRGRVFAFGDAERRGGQHRHTVVRQIEVEANAL